MTPPFSFPSGVRGPCAIFVASNKFARIYIARYPALRFELSDVYYVFPGAKRTVAVTGQNVIQESKSIIQKMRDTPKKDISGTCETRSWELLSTTDRFHALLRHYCEWFFKRVALLAGDEYKLIKYKLVQCIFILCLIRLSKVSEGNDVISNAALRYYEGI